MTKYLLFAISALFASSFANADWRPHPVQLLNGDEVVAVPGRMQIVTESWNRVVAVPYIVYMPEKDRILMLVSCDYPHQAMTLWSDDHGATWSEPTYVHVRADRKGDTGMGIGLTYLGEGKVVLTAGSRWFSNDYGETWPESVAVPPLPDGKTWNGWDPLFVDRDAKMKTLKRLLETGYSMDHSLWESNGGPGYSKGHLRISADNGRTWGEPTKVPEWDGVSEVTIIRAANGDLVAACRTDKPVSQKLVIDHCEGLAVSISKDDGTTWSALNRLYAWGRHHPCLTLIPDKTLVMTYVVRMGYTNDTDGIPRFAVEAIVSYDNGETWDLDHRYVLHWWKGNRTGPDAWWASSQATSTIQLPDRSLVTAFGTGYRSQPNENKLPAPRDVGIVQWRISEVARKLSNTITNAPLESDARNVFDPAILR